MMRERGWAGRKQIIYSVVTLQACYEGRERCGDVRDSESSAAQESKVSLNRVSSSSARRVEIKTIITINKPRFLFFPFCFSRAAHRATIVTQLSRSLW